MLGFTPQNLKNDGSFPALRVTVKPSADLNLQARRGYYAPKHVEDPEETARQEIGSALFSREEIQQLPIGLNTQFFKPNAQSAKLTVVVRLNLKQFKYRKVNDRNCNVVTMVYGIVDRNGHYMQGIKKVIDLKLKEDTLVNRLGQPATVRTIFDVTPGTYLVRLVVRAPKANSCRPRTLPSRFHTKGCRARNRWPVDTAPSPKQGWCRVAWPVRPR